MKYISSASETLEKVDRCWKHALVDEFFIKERERCTNAVVSTVMGAGVVTAIYNYKVLSTKVYNLMMAKASLANSSIHLIGKLTFSPDHFRSFFTTYGGGQDYIPAKLTKTVNSTNSTSTTNPSKLGHISQLNTFY